jgi:hypothetical protein
MNNIFHKLANDAWIDVPEGQGYGGKIFSKEKFAELIVRECARVASNQVMDVEGNDWGVRHAVEKHFGVKE